ncbi:E3 ubiquitin-protein ligase TM129 [Frankliniella fusca]|uniref:E3 ubiquitin-protein ligase TM129 n=1 Tax=Frankliniella fusca TaxID=407009 RepID=A0AAE1GZG4_9NEOP|nr:E3 ubiquitin-protein ligase TM129 [Frankliniella fusca]
MTSPSVYFSLFYVVLTLCIIFPPPEFKSAGLTLEAIFQKWLGSENEMFIQYHVKRTTMNLFLHSMVPFGYILGLEYVRAYSYADVEQQLLPTWSYSWKIYVVTATLIPLTVCALFFWWFPNLWRNHPISRKLAVYANPGATWWAVASDINIEFRRVNKITIQSSSVVRVVATDNWVIKISPYTLDVAHQSDTALILSSADVHPWSPHINDNVQFVNIEVKPTRQNAQPFKIRLNALDLKDLQNRITRPITVLENVRVQGSLIDRFLETFSDEVAKNPVYSTSEELESCIGCMQVTANVKLRKMCEEEPAHRDNCTNCYCRPMWCVDCMARWFASRQDKEPATWLSSKCSCPLCRARFCILDVSPVVQE